MDWHDEAARGLPAPRDDEPATLRDDICDELADHLQCALNRELTRNISPAEAVAKVLSRFGNPRTIARRLWLDAMQEKLMSQRLTLATMAILACVSIAATSICWVALRESRAANAAILDKMTALVATPRDSSVELARVAESNAKVLEDLKAISAANLKASQTATPSDWCRVKFHFVQGKKDGPPLPQVQLTLLPSTGGITHGEVQIEKTSDAHGEADCGFVHYGDYNIQLQSPWQDTFWEEGVHVRPGVVLERTIVCPTGPLAHCDVRFRFNWPGDRPQEKLWLVLRVMPFGRSVEGATWSAPGAENDPLLVADLDGNVLSSDARFWFQRPSPTLGRSVPGQIRPTKLYLGEMGFNPCTFVRISDRRFVGDRGCLGWSNQRFLLGEIAIVRAQPDPTEPQDVIAGPRSSRRKSVLSKHAVLGYQALADGPRYDTMRPQDPEDVGDFWQPIRVARIVRPSALEPYQTFQPTLGKENVWTVPIRDSLIAQVRTALTKAALPKPAKDDSSKTPASK